jgi:DNA-binding LytR/AlgR family response regulator
MYEFVISKKYIFKKILCSLSTKQEKYGKISLIVFTNLSRKRCTMQIAVCDDDKSICSQLENMIETYLLTNNIRGHIDVFYSAESLQSFMKQEKSYDILFLDIEMEGMNGVELGHFLRDEMENNQTEIIYISWESSYAMDLFKIRPMDFIIKPLTQDNIYTVLERTFKLLNRNDDYFTYSLKGDIGRVKINDIVYFSSNGRKICVHTINENIEFYGKLDEVMTKVDMNFFWRIHKSCLINYFQSKKFEYTQVMMNDGSKLSISQKYRVDIRNKQKNVLKSY